MSKLFFYKRIVTLPPIKDGAESETRIFLDGFNADYIIRTVHQADGTCIVLLDDGHEESVNKEIKNDKGKVIETKRERDYYFSQITLQNEDRLRLMRALEVYPKVNGEDIPSAIKEAGTVVSDSIEEREKVNANKGKESVSINDEFDKLLGTDPTTNDK